MRRASVTRSSGRTSNADCTPLIVEKPDGLDIDISANGNVTFDPLRGFEISHNLLNLPSEVRIPAGTGGLIQDVELAETVFYADGTRAGVIDPGTGEWTSRYIGSLIYSGTDGGETLVGIVTADGFVDRSAWFGFAGKENEMWDGRAYTAHWLPGERYQHFGARTYDPASCIFLQTDPLAEKYYGFSPYAYCNGDPGNLVDPDGNKVVPLSNEALGMIRSTLSLEDRVFVQLNNNKEIDFELMSSHTSQSDNYNSLLVLSGSSMTIEVILGSTYEFISQFGITGVKEMSYMGVDDYFIGNFNGKGVGTTTGETGLLGKTLFPGRNAEQNSISDNIQVVINDGLSNQGRVEAFSHEAYGHAYMYVKTIKNYTASTHQNHRGMVDLNRILYDRIVRSINETVFYFK